MLKVNTDEKEVITKESETFCAFSKEVTSRDDNVALPRTSKLLLNVVKADDVTIPELNILNH